MYGARASCSTVPAPADQRAPGTARTAGGIHRNPAPRRADRQGRSPTVRPAPVQSMVRVSGSLLPLLLSPEPVGVRLHQVPSGRGVPNPERIDGTDHPDGRL